jgi:hypothetical protein
MIAYVFQEDRVNPIDRNTAAIHLGYSGLSGAADKTLSTLVQYGLLEKAGKGEVRVSPLAVSIMHPNHTGERLQALKEAARNPPAFKQILERFPNGMPSKAALESWLVREGYQDRAIAPVVRSFLETMSFIRSEGVELEGEDSQNEREPLKLTHSDIEAPVQHPVMVPAPAAKSEPSVTEREQVGGEWFRVRLGANKTITISVVGDEAISERDIDKLIILLEAQKVALQD